MPKRRRITRYNERIGPELTPGMMTLAVFLATVIILSVYFACNAAPPVRGVDTDEITFGGAGTDAPIETDPVPDEKTDVITVPNSQIDTGYLILVNGDHKYDFAEADRIVSLYGNDDRSDSYGLATSSIACREDVLDDLNMMLDAYKAATDDGGSIINSAYRTSDEQREILVSRIESDGEEEAYKYVAQPGYSEHHTGLSFDIAAQEDRTWLSQNCQRFGFVQRYRADKEELTGIAYEYWHYRYVGDPHAEIMMTENLCMEEYLTLLSMYTYSDPYTYKTADGDEYMIYYTPCGGDGETLIQVPRGADYTVSGDNVGGFITTVRIGIGGGE